MTVPTPLARSVALVWIMAPTVAGAGHVFPWSWSSWALQPRLVPLDDELASGDGGSASFAMLRQRRAEEADATDPLDGHVHTPATIVPGSWVALTGSAPTMDDPDSPGTTILDPDKVLWWGFIERVQPTTLEADTDAVGTVHARQVGALLDAIQLHGFAQKKHHPSNYPEALNTPPTANLAGNGSKVIGNAKNATDNDGAPFYLFSRTMEDCSTLADNLWTRWRLLRHVLRFTLPPLLPQMEAECDDNSQAPDPTGDTIAGYLNRTTTPEVMDVRTPTARGVLDLLVPRSHGLGWTIRIGRTKWKLRISTLADSAAYGLPAAVVSNIDLADLNLAEAPEWTDGGEVLDEVVVEGAPVLVGVTAGNEDGNLDKAWTASQQDAYEASDPRERGRPQYADVFTLYRLLPVNGDLRRRTIPGENGGVDKPMVPRLSWVSGTLGVTDTSAAPYLPAATLARMIPWEEGRATYAGDDLRSVAMKATPTWRKPQAFVLDDNGWQQFTDVYNTDLPSLQIDAEDRAAGLRLTASPAHLLALDRIVSGSFDSGGQPEIIDWKDIKVTVGIWSDQRVRVSILRAGVSSGNVRRRLVVREERLQCWLMLGGTIVGLKLTDGEMVPDRIEADTFTRNDWPTAQAYAERLAAWGFRSRRALTLTLAQPGALPAWARINATIGTVMDDAANLGASNTAVVSIRRQWAEGRVAITTEIPERPEIVGVTSPSGGGGVSVNLGGTVPGSLLDTRNRVAAMAADLQRVPIHLPRGAPASSRMILRIVDGNTVESGTGILGIKYSSSKISTVSSLYDPEVAATLPDGLGRAELWVDGRLTGHVLVVNSTGYGSPVSHIVVAGMEAETWAPEKLTLAGDPTQSVTAYVMRMMN
jgi:hypothetical protein